MMVSPVKIQGEEEEIAHSEVKKSRNRHLVIINQLRKKEEAWNSRFYLDHIPKYNCIEDRNCETYQKILIKKKSKNFVLRKEAKGQTLLDFTASRKRQGDDSSSVAGANKRPESHDRPPVDPRLRGMYPSEIRPRDKIRAESMKRSNNADNLLREKKFQQERLLATWDRLSIPMFHREAFLKCENLQNLKQTIEILKREQDEIETKCSSIQAAIKAVTARENCLKQLRATIQKTTDQETFNEEEIKQKARELLTHLRLISLNVIETIMRWREYIHNTYYSSRTPIKAPHINPIPFVYNQSNYFNKMKTDTKDLVNTPLANYFAFASKSDPFFIELAKESEGKTTISIPKDLVGRIKACDFTLQNESTTDLNGYSPLTPPIKITATPSDRSLNPEQAANKKNNIKIRNTSLTKQRKDVSADGYGKGENQAKLTNSSHPSTQNNLTEGEIDAKAQSLLENPSNLTDRLQAQPLPSPKENKPEKAVEKVPEKVEKVIEKVPEKIEEPKPVEVKAEEGSSSIQPVDRYEDEIQEYLNMYLQDIDQNMKDSFLSDPKVLLERANMGQDPVWFELVSASGAQKKRGLAVAHIDNTVFTARRMVILHFTAEDRELYHDFLSQFVEYLWKNDECNEIKISLYHLEDQNGNFGSDKNLEQAIKKLGFRWKQLTNDKYTGKRYIDYMLKRPEGAVCTVAKNSDEPIHVKSVVVLSDLDGETNVNRAPKCLFDNRYAVLSAALKHCEDKLDKLGDTDTKRGRNYLQVISSLVKEGQKKIGELTGKFQNLDELQAFIKEKLEEKSDLAPKIDSKFSKNIFTTSLLNLIYRWKSFNITDHKVQGKDRRYLKIHNSGDLVQFQSKYKNSSIYFIPTDDSEVNIFLTDNDAIVNEIINKEEIIEDSVSKLFSKLEKTPTPFQEDLWVPLFSLKDSTIDLEDAKGLLQGEYKLNYATNTCEIALNGARVRGNLKVRPSEKSKIIEKPFLFGILHDQVDFPLFSVVVQPQDFAQSNM